MYLTIGDTPEKQITVDGSGEICNRPQNEVVRFFELYAEFHEIEFKNNVLFEKYHTHVELSGLLDGILRAKRK